jgi:methanethiol S-methyltransferase
MQSYFILFLLWIVFYFLHSFLITKKSKNAMQKLLKSKYRYYRLSYNIFSTIAFLLIIGYSATIPVAYAFDKNAFTNYTGLFLAVFGVIIGKRGFKPYNTQEFLGIQQIKHPGSTHNLEGNGLKTEGMLSKVRHPLYSATILLFLGFWLFSPSVANTITVASALLYLVVGIKLEERKLIKEFGQQYIEYKKRVPMLIPKISIK